MNPYDSLEMNRKYILEYRDVEDEVVVDITPDPQKEECDIFVAVTTMISFIFFIGMIGAIIYAYTH